MRILVIMLMLVAGLEGRVRAATPERIAGLIERLGSTDYRERQAAFSELDAIGESALPPLKTTTIYGDSETRLRASELIRRIEQRQISARILTPTLVELEFENIAVEDAVKAVNKATGIQLAVSGTNVAEVNKRKITYRTGKVPAWEAVSGFLAESKLVEWDTVTVVAGLPTPNPIMMNTTHQVFFNGGRARRVMINNNTGRREEVAVLDKTLIYDGTPVNLPTSLAGAVRVRALPIGTPIPNAIGNSDEYLVPLQISAEAKVDCSATSASIKSTQAIDDQGRRFNAVITGLVRTSNEDPEMVILNNMFIANQNVGAPSNNAVRNQFVALRIRKGTGVSKSLREVTGTIALPVRVNAELVAMEQPMKAAGKTVREEFGEITVHSIDKTSDGNIKLDVSVVYPHDVRMSSMAGIPNAAMVNFRGNGAVLPAAAGSAPIPGNGKSEILGISLREANGNRLLITSYVQPSINHGNDGMRVRTTMMFHLSKDAVDPTRLSVNGSHAASVEVAFTLKNVPVQ